MKSKKRQKQLAEKRAKHASRMKAGGSSNYARKRKYLTQHGLHGTEVSDPKPWKSMK